MSTSRTNSVRRSNEHFEPGDDGDPHAQRRLRGQLEQIDYTAYAANKEVISYTVGSVDAQKFQRLGVATAQARSRWVAAALAATESLNPPSLDQVQKLSQLRMAYEELSEVYDALRRMVERGYVPFSAPNV